MTNSEQDPGRDKKRKIRPIMIITRDEITGERMAIENYLLGPSLRGKMVAIDMKEGKAELFVRTIRGPAHLKVTRPVSSPMPTEEQFSVTRDAQGDISVKRAYTMLRDEDQDRTPTKYTLCTNAGASLHLNVLDGTVVLEGVDASEATKKAESHELEASVVIEVTEGNVIANKNKGEFLIRIRREGNLYFNDNEGSVIAGVDGDIHAKGNIFKGDNALGTEFGTIIFCHDGAKNPLQMVAVSRDVKAPDDFSGYSREPTDDRIILQGRELILS